MNVPIPEREVGIQAPGIQTPQIQPITQAASGANIGEAVAGFGQTIAGVAEKIGQHLIERRKQDMEQDVYNRATAYSRELHGVMSSVDESGNPSGILSRQGANARGSVVDFDTADAALRKKHGMGASPLASQMLTRLFDSHGFPLREAALQHEVQQEEVGREHSEASQVAALKTSASMAPDAKSFLDAAESAASVMSKAMTRKGIIDENERSVKLKTVYDDFAEDAVISRLDSNPEAAKKLLSDIGGNLSDMMRAKLEKAVNGKWLEMRSRSIAKELLVPGTKFMDREGTVNLAAVLEETKNRAKDLPDTQKYDLQDNVRSLIPIAEAGFKRNYEISTAKFQNSALDLWRKGTPYDQAHDQMFKGPNAYRPIDNVDFKKQEDWMMAVWAGHKERMLAALSSSQKEAIDEVKNAAKGYFRKEKIQLPGEDFKRDPVDLFNKTIDDKAIMGKWSAKQIRDYGRDTLQKIPHGDQRIFRIPGILPTGLPFSRKAQAFQVELEHKYPQSEPARAWALEKLKSLLKRDPTQQELDKIIPLYVKR